MEKRNRKKRKGIPFDDSKALVGCLQPLLKSVRANGLFPIAVTCAPLARSASVSAPGPGPILRICLVFVRICKRDNFAKNITVDKEILRKRFFISLFHAMQEILAAQRVCTCNPFNAVKKVGNLPGSSLAHVAHRSRSATAVF